MSAYAHVLRRPCVLSFVDSAVGSISSKSVHSSRLSLLMGAEMPKSSPDVVMSTSERPHDKKHVARGTEQPLHAQPDE